MRVNANAVLRSWTLLAAFGGSYAPAEIHTQDNYNTYTLIRKFTCRQFLLIQQLCAIHISSQVFKGSDLLVRTSLSYQH